MVFSLDNNDIPGGICAGLGNQMSVLLQPCVSTVWLP